jgi:hypothetical protein
MKSHFLVCVPLVVLFAAIGLSAQDSEETKSVKKANTVNRLYIVQMSESPVIDYKGDIPGFKATKPAKGQKIDPASGDVAAYTSLLDRRHDDLVAKAGGRKVYDYRYTFNGFAAELTSAQAEAVKGVAGVLAVSKDELQFADTSSTPAFLGLSDSGGLWDQLGGFGRAGENIIIGLIDSGVWPEGRLRSHRRERQRYPGWQA